MKKDKLADKLISEVSVVPKNRWYKGMPSPNPQGRLPEGQSVMDQFKEAIRNVEAKKRKPLFQHLIERAYVDDTVLIAVARKILPDKIQDDTLKNAVRTFLVRASGIPVPPTPIDAQPPTQPRDK